MKTAKNLKQKLKHTHTPKAKPNTEPKKKKNQPNVWPEKTKHWKYTCGIAFRFYI